MSNADPILHDVPPEPQPGVLSQLRGEFVVWHNLKFALVLVAAVGLIALAAVGLDAAVVLAEAARAQAPWLLALGAAGVVVAAVLGLRRLRELWVAQTLEAEDAELGTGLTNAVELIGKPQATATGELLRRRAVARGRDLATGRRAWPVARRGLKMAGAAALGTLGLWLLGAALFTDVFRAVLPRYLDPQGDHPPYSRLRIDVEPGDTEVLYGGDCVVSATTSGVEVEKLTLVVRRGDHTDRIFMFLGPEGSFFQTLTNLRQDTEYYVTYGRARTHRHTIRIQTVPQIELVELESALPDYTRVPPQREHLAGFTLTQPLARRLPPGTRLAFRAASNRPLAHGLLTLTPADDGEPRTVRLTPGDRGDEVQGGFTLTESVELELTLVDVSGTPSTDAVRGTIELRPDAKPVLSVVEPGKDAFATPDVVVPVVVEADDDYGVTAIRWTRTAPDGKEETLDLTLEPEPGARSVAATTSLDLGALGVEPGDTLEYFFEATDSFPDGPNVSLSRLFRLRVISHDEHRKLVRRLLRRRRDPLDDYQRLADHLRRLAERAGALDERTRRLDRLGNASDAERQALSKEARALQRELARYQDALDRQLELPTALDAEERFREVLAGQRPALQSLQKKLDRAAPDPLAMPTEVGEVAEGLAQMCEQCEQDIEVPAEHLQAVGRLLARAQAFAQLSQRQQEVARAGKEFDHQLGECSRVEEMKLRDLADAERRVHDAVSELEREMPGLIDDLPDDERYDELRQTAQGFLDQLKASRAGDDLAEASDEFGRLRGRFGYPPARDAARKMDELVQEVRPMQGQGRAALRFQPSLQAGQSLKQMLARMLGAGEFGRGSQGGYAMAPQEYGLYGPDFEMPHGGGRGPDTARSGPGRDVEHITDASDPADPDLDLPEARGHVSLVPNVRYPLRYRRLVGDYFRAIADAQSEKEPRR
ncbi:MAG: hypothetical protein ACOC8D_00545 [bacterium]